MSHCTCKRRTIGTCAVEFGDVESKLHNGETPNDCGVSDGDSGSYPTMLIGVERIV
jgi:hypothetical protein